MKNAKKILAVLLSVAMLVTMFATFAFATEPTTPTTGSIKISNTTSGETYLVYKVFDLTYATPLDKDDSGVVTSPVAYSYTVKEAKEGSELVCTIEGHEHTDECYDAFFAALTGSDSLFTLTATTDAGVYNVTLKSDIDASDIAEFLSDTDTDGNVTAASFLGNPVAGEEENGTGSTLTFDKLDFGYYFITSSLGSVVTIDSTIPDVTVVDKNQVPSWDNGDDGIGKVIIDTVAHCGKEEHTHSVENGCYEEDGTTLKCTKEEHTHTEDCYKVTYNSVNYGDTVTFDIGINATNNINDEYITYYYITDTLGDGFVIPENFAPVITVGDTELDEDEDDYTLTINGNTFEIVIPWATETTKTEGEGTEAKTIVTAIAPKFADASTHEIHVRYTANIAATGEDVVIAGDGNPNTANYTYNTNKPGEEPDKPGDKEPYTDSNKRTTKTFVYAIAIEKVDQDEKPLAGATFSVTDADGNSITAVATDVAGEYKFSASGVSTFATDANGYLVIKGLEKGTYTVTEVDAPAGYNKLTDTVDIDAACTGSSTSTITTTYYYDKDGNLTNVEEVVEGDAKPTYTENKENFDNVPAYKIEIVNNKGSELPATGGMGTVLFIAIGAVLLVGAGLILTAKKRLYNEG